VISLVEVLTRHWPAYRQRHGEKILPSHRAAVAAILKCHTPAQGGGLYHCSRCAQHHFTWHSCGNRACPQCGHHRASRWIENQSARLLPVAYFMVTFTVPQALRNLIRREQKFFYQLLFEQSAATLQDVAANPKHLDARLGMLGLLHTWSRQLVFHPHIHYLVAAGGVTADGAWRPTFYPDFLLPVRVLSVRFRSRIRAALQQQRAQLHDSIDPKIWTTPWVVHSQCAGNGQGVVRYLSTYIYKTAITSTRIIKDQDGCITFSYRDSNSGQWRQQTLGAMEFIRRFLQHILPKGFRRVRTFGWLAPAAKRTYSRICALLDWKPASIVKKEAPLVVLCPNCNLPMSFIAHRARAP